MTLRTEQYSQQERRWPKQGRHILAQFDDDSVVVYQAFRPETGRFAAAHGYFGNGFSLNRMSWIKPNFLWMMYRCGWGAKANQETVLAITIRRAAFDEILAGAVHSSFDPEIYGAKDQWEMAVAGSDVRLQWDPDHEPSGKPTIRRAIQLGLRGDILARYSREWIVGIEDISDFAREQKARLESEGTTALMTPSEGVYPIADHETARRLGIDKEVNESCTQTSVKISKFLSLVLRHKPEEIGIVLDPAGWVDVDVLLAAMAAHRTPMTMEMLREIVAGSDKQRFAFSEDGRRIRANQGHSVEVELGYEPAIPPEILYHGTAERFLASIQAVGLVKGKRHHVHLSAAVETARTVGKRHGKLVLLRIASGEMHRAGHAFFLSANGVWLTEAVPVKFFEVMNS